MSAQLDTKYMSEVLIALSERGFELPFKFAIIGINGSIMAVAIDQNPDDPGWNCKFLAEHVPPEGLIHPLNMMVVDRSGKAARVVLRPGRGIEVIN